MVSHVPERPVGLRRGIPEHRASCWGIEKLDVNLGNSALGKAEPASLSRAGEQLRPSCDSVNDYRELSPQSRIFFCLTLKPRAWWGSVRWLHFCYSKLTCVWASVLIPFQRLEMPGVPKEQLFILSATLLGTNHWMRNCGKLISGFKSTAHVWQCRWLRFTCFSLYYNRLILL